MKTKIFSYNGYVGAETDLNEGKFINNPKEEGQLGCVIDTKEVEMTAEAKELIKNAPREGGSFASIMLTKHPDGTSSIALFGFWKHAFGPGRGLEIGRTCEVEVLDDIKIVELEVPQEFKDFVDSIPEEEPEHTNG